MKLKFDCNVKQLSTREKTYCLQPFGELIKSLVIHHFRCDVDDVKNYTVALPSYMAKGLNLSFLEIKFSQIYETR